MLIFNPLNQLSQLALTDLGIGEVRYRELQIVEILPDGR